MAHLVRIWSDDALKVGLKPTGQNFRDLDQNTLVSINGDGGGTWAPTADILILGQGMVCAGPWVFPSATNAGFVLAPIRLQKGTADDYFKLSSFNNSYDLVDAIVEVFAEIPDTVRPNQSTAISGGTVLGVLTTVQPAGVTGPVRFSKPLRVYNGATLESVTFAFTVSAVHANVPEHLPSVRVVAVDVNGNIYPMGDDSGAGGIIRADADGWEHFNGYVTGADWYNSGNMQFHTYNCVKNNVIDISQYDYRVEIQDEWGANSTGLNIYSNVKSHFDGITLFDGRS